MGRLIKFNGEQHQCNGLCPENLSDGRIATFIEIDCSPMTPRPDTYMRHICEKILKVPYYDPCPIGPLAFGCWEWDVIYKNKEQQDAVGEYLKSVYDGFKVRYASW